MKKRIIAASTLLALVVGISLTVYAGTATTSEANIPSETSDTEATLTAGVSLEMSKILTQMEEDCSQICIESTDAPTVGSSMELKAEVHELKETDDIEEINRLIAECTSRMDAATKMVDACVELGYEEDDPVLLLAHEEYSNAEFDYNYYIELLADAERALRRSEYPAATIVWDYLTINMGLNEHVAAGILGNMMAEVGGQTLALETDCYGRGYYGICQWRIEYMVYNITYSDLETQLDYLANTIEEEFKVFGDLHKSGFTYADFCNLQDEQTAALAFAEVYERCGSGSYYVRKQNATNAYNYYTE